MQIRCPHCQNAIEVIQDSPLTDIVCTVCGSSFSLIGDETLSCVPENKKLGRFELLERLGIGAFDTVWKARDPELDRLVAVKIPRHERLSPQEKENFYREARAAAQVPHPHIVTVHEVGRDGDTSYIVSDFVQGVTLTDWLAVQRPTPEAAAELCAKIAEAVHAAHEAGVVHRDLKPSNILLDAEQQPHVTDFGLAKREAGEITMTVEGQILGTPA